MNTSEEISSDQDPDYVPVAVNNEKQQKIYEENARSNTARKISAIVNKEFSEEVDAKEKEILQIQERLHKALKTLHLLRYVIITDYYNRKQCLLPQAGVAKQTRIHPAVKQLIGKSPRITQDHAVPSTSRTLQSLNGSEYAVASTSKLSENNVFEHSEVKEECKTENAEKRNLENEDCRPKKIPRYVPPKCANPEPPCPSRGIRHKVRKRIVVGNISKWIPPDWREDAASHKWTMYVRSSKEDVEISDFVSKVRFFLHPSYRPNDVVEVTSAPFHLSRRGWGEFPLRVQLHFKNPLNKPMDIIHHLKLDRTYTGLQTLGSETLVDVWIHTAEPRTHSSNLEHTDEYAEDDSLKRISPAKEVTVTNVCNISNLPPIYLNKEKSTDAKESRKSTSGSYEEEHNVPQNAFTDGNILIKNTDSSSKECTDMGKVGACQDSIVHSSVVAIKEESEEGGSLNDCCRLNKLDSMTALTADNYVIKPEPIDYTCNIAGDTKKLLSYVYLDHNYLGDKFLKDCNYTVEQNLSDSKLQINHKFETQSMHFSGSLKNVSNVIDIPRSKRLTSILRRNINSTNNSDPDASTTFTTQNKTNKSAISPLQDEQNVEHRPIVYDSKVLQKAGNTLKTDLQASLRLANGSLNDTIGSSLNVEDNANAFTLNRRSTDVQKMSSSTVSRVSDLQPLKISIPSAFETSTRKLLIVKNSRSSVPTEMIKIVATKTDDRSLLKKSFHNTNGPFNTKSSGISVLKVKPMNSLLLNVNDNVPALKIAGCHASNINAEDGGFNYPILNVQEEKPAKAKVTLGKDKHKIQSKRDLYEETLRTIEMAKIDDVETFLRFAIRRLPIITPNATDPDYKRLHPYACVTQEEFASHNIGKQRAYEWYRAKMLHSLIQRKVQSEDRLWTMKEIIIWSRIHGHMPIFTTLGVSADISSMGAKNVLDSVNSSTFSTCTEPIAFREWIETSQRKKRNRAMDESDAHDSQDEDIDIIHVDESLRIKPEPQRIDLDCSKELQNITVLELEKNLLPLFDFVNETARDIGIRLLPEEIVPNVLHCVAGRAVMRVIECFVEDLVRGSFAKACERTCGKGYPKMITLDDVRGALTSREEFDIFTNEGLGTQYQPDTSN